MAHEAGKGSAPRPFSISQEEYNNRWDTIFSRDKISKEIEADNKKQEEKQLDSNLSKEPNS